MSVAYKENSFIWAMYQEKICYLRLIFKVMRCAIWYYFYNLGNVKNTNGRVLLLVK